MKIPKLIHIELGRKEFPVAFTFSAIAKIEEDFDCSYLYVNYSARWTLGLIYRGIEDGCRKKAEKFELTKEFIADNLNQEVVQKIWTYWNEVVSWGEDSQKVSEEELDEEPKKKK